MNIYVKLTGETIETLRTTLGVNGGTLDLSKGLLRLNDKNAVAALAEKQMIDNVNNQTYEQFLASIAKAEKAAETSTENQKAEKPQGEATAKEMSSDERNKIIGWKPTVGSIVRINSGKDTEHVVILAVDEEKFTAATVRLKQTNIPAEGAVILVKGKDVLYKNQTYRDKVTVTKEVTYGLTADQFKKGSGGMIVGKVIKMDKLQDLIDYANSVTAETEA